MLYIVSNKEKRSPLDTLDMYDRRMLCKLLSFCLEWIHPYPISSPTNNLGNSHLLCVHSIASATSHRVHPIYKHIHQDKL